METLQTLMDAFGELGGTLIAVIFMLVALLLAGLIVRASQPNQKSDPATGKNRYATETAEPEPVAKSVPQPVVNPAPVIKAAISEPTQLIKSPAAPATDQRYDAEREAQKAALANPYPTDSVLRRHYEALHNIQPATAQAEPEVAVIIPPKASKPRGSIIEMAINKDEQAAPAAAKPTFANVTKPLLPEDSVLKRHFIQQQQAIIVAEMGPKPTDSVLKRHYEAVLQQALAQRLNA